jgi:hypothetical protein
VDQSPVHRSRALPSSETRTLRVDFGGGFETIQVSQIVRSCLQVIGGERDYGTHANFETARSRKGLYSALLCSGGVQKVVPVVGWTSWKPPAFTVRFLVLVICTVVSGKSTTVYPKKNLWYVAVVCYFDK